MLNRKLYLYVVLVAVLSFIGGWMKLHEPAGSFGAGGGWDVENAFSGLLKTPEARRVHEHFELARQAREGGRIDTALREIDLAVAALAKLPAPVDSETRDRQRRIRLMVYLAKAQYHDFAWQYVPAAQSYEQALKLAGNGHSRSTIESGLRRMRSAVDGLNDERNQHSAYRASPDRGPVRVLSGRVAVINLFVEDGGGGTWGLKQRDFMQRARGRAERWLQQRARSYAAEVSFSHRDFLLKHSPDLKRLKVSADSSKRFRQGELLLRKAVRELGEHTVRSFVKRILREEGVDQAAMMVYLPRKGRSWARRCHGRCSLPAEYSVLMVSPRGSGWQRAEYAWAHESLHLFGADDLYNVKGARYYAPRDIMNYPSRVLMASTLEPLTAFAVGLRSTAPATPFPIQQE